MEENKFQLLRRFQYSSEAIIYQGKLESQDIAVFLRDNHTVDSNPLYSNAVGGVKLFVKTEDFEKANQILGEISLYSVDEDHELIKCPKCGETEVAMVTSVKDWKSLFSFVFFLLLCIAPFSVRHKYKCMNCKYEFN